MLNFDGDRFLRIESGALALSGPIHAAIGEALAKGAKNVTRFETHVYPNSRRRFAVMGGRQHLRVFRHRDRDCFLQRRG